MKPEILENVSIFLLKKGFTIKSLTRNCFDILARRKGKILLIKILEDANSISPEYIEQMKNLSAYITASPLIISEKAGKKLHDGVVYSRMGINTLNLNTFKDAIENKLPFVFSTKAGFTASIKSDKLKKKREELGLSQNSLSRKVGVSSRMIAKYENEDAEVTLKKAFKLYDIFGGEIFDKVDVFDYDSHIGGTSKSPLSRKYIDLGFNASETKKVPFDIIAKKEDEIILTEVGDKDNSQLKSLSRLIDADQLVIFKKKKPKDIPSLTKEEFLDFEKANELIKFLKEF